jgi:hypothetical protein
MERYLMAKQLMDQCTSDEDVIVTLRAINGLFNETSANEKTEKRREKKTNGKNPIREAKLGDWPRKACMAKETRRVTLPEVWQYMKDQEVDYLLPQGLEEATIKYSMSKNLGRTWRTYPDGSWGLIPKKK